MPRTSTEDSPSTSRRERIRLHQARERRRQRRGQLIVAAITIGLAVVIIGGAVLATQLSRRSTESSTGSTVVNGKTVPLQVDGSAVTVGQADAPVAMDLWVDYSCPHCQEFEATNADLLAQNVADGTVRVSYHNIQIVTAYGTQAGSVGACVASQQPASWWKINSALYANHTTATDGWGSADFATWAKSQGVTASGALDCISAGRNTATITNNTVEAAQKNVTSTPTMFLNGQVQSPTPTGQALQAQINQLAGK